MTDSKHVKTDENTRPHAFICFSVSGTRDEALALVFDFKYYAGYHCELFFTHLSLSQEYMPLPPGKEEEKSSDQNSEPKLQFSYVECLIFAFHQLAKKV